MHLFINGKETDISSGTSIRGLLDSMEIRSDRGMAIAVNGVVVPGSRWRELEVEEGDTVEIIRATQGG
jgi:sulfur carrier protein